MHLLTLTTPFTRANGDVLNAGTYIMEDVTAFEVGQQAERGSVELHIDRFCRKDFAAFMASLHGNAPPSMSVLLIANMGFGDALMLTPAIRAFHRKYPYYTLTISCPAKTHVVFSGMEREPNLIPYPPDAHTFADSFCTLTTEHLQESSEAGKAKHAIDIKADVLGVGPLSDDEKKVHYVVTEFEKEWALKEFPRKEAMKRIGLHVNASGPTRTPHPQWITNLIDKMWDHEDWEIVCMGTAKKFDVPPMIQERVRSAMDRGYTFRETAAILSTCDILVGPDSALIHVAGALGMPAVGLFAVVPWELRTKFYPSVRVLQGHSACSPCYWHPRNGGPLWPADKPCAKLGFCQPLSEIPPERVVREVEKSLSTIQSA